MSSIGNAAEEIIKRAIQDGAFDNLPGKGQPLHLSENPYEPAEWRIAYSLLRSNGYSLPWLEVRKEIEEAIDRARTDARDAWHSNDEKHWVQHRIIFSQRIEALNRRIFQYNLQAPSPVFHRQHLVFEQEVERIQRGESEPSSFSEGR